MKMKELENIKLGKRANVSIKGNGRIKVNYDMEGCKSLFLWGR